MTEQVNVIPSESRQGEEKRYLVRWKNRQKMAWLSFWFIIFFTFMQWFVLPVWYDYMNVDQQKWGEHITDSSTYLYGALWGVIFGYMGFTAWSLKGNNFTVKEEDY